MVSLNVVSVTYPHFSHSMLTTMVMCHNFMLEKHFYYTISMFQRVQESATSCDFYRRRQVDVFVLKTVEACAKFHEACQQTGLLFMGLYMTMNVKS